MLWSQVIAVERPTFLQSLYPASKYCVYWYSLMTCLLKYIVDWFKYVSMIKHAFNLMTNTKWTFTFLFPIVLSNTVMLNDCASATVKLWKALEWIMSFFKNLFLILSKTNRVDCFLHPRVFSLNRTEMGWEEQEQDYLAF